MPPTITRVKPADYPRLLTIQADSVQNLTAFYEPTEIQAWIEYVKSETSARYANFHNLACRDKSGTIVAFISWTSTASGGNVECLYVQENQRDHGLATHLLQAAESKLSGKTIRVRSTLNARTFYEQHGFNFTGFATSRAGLKIATLEKPPLSYT